MTHPHPHRHNARATRELQSEGVANGHPNPDGRDLASKGASANPPALRWEPPLYAKGGAEVADADNGRSHVKRIRPGARTWEARVNGVVIGASFASKAEAKLACEWKAELARELAATRRNAI